MAFYSAGLFLVVFLSLFMILLLGGRREMRGAVPMLFLLVGISLWSLCQLLHIYVIDPQLKYVWYQAKFTGIVMIPAAFLSLAADLSVRRNFIKGWHKGVLITVPLMTLAAILTDPWFHLFRKSVDYVIADEFILIMTVDGPAFWGFTGYSYILIIISALLLLEKAWKSTGAERRQSQLMLFGCLFPWVSNILFLMFLDPEYPLDYTPVFLLVTEIVFLITLFYYRMFSIVPFTKQAVFENLQDLILVIDRQGIIQDMNPSAREVFRTGSSPMGRNISEFLSALSPVYRGPLLEMHGEFQGIRAGLSRDYALQTTPIAGPSGAEVGKLLVFKDITELSDSRRAQEAAIRELALQNENKMLFVKQMNRNIRIPMNKILGFAEIFGQKNLSESQQEAVEHLTVSGGHLIQLINNITDYSKIETGKMELKEEAVQLFDVVRHVCRLFEYQAEQKGVMVCCTINPDLPVTIRSDSLRLTQVLSNVMGNAVKFTEKGKVTLTVRKLEGPWMEMEIRDTGIGISESNISRLFTPYQQVEEGAALKFGGTGLGLAIVKELVDRMGGDIHISSVLGEGTCIRLELPCVESPADSPVYNLDQMSDYRSKPLHVGLVMLDAVQTTLIRRFFRAWPQAVCYDIADVKSGLNPQIPWTLFLLDVDHIPPVEVLESLRRGGIGKNQRPPALVGMTNDTDTAEEQKAEHSLLDDCMLMPLSFSTLNRILRRIILRQG